jgi:hypothetical protein
LLTGDFATTVVTGSSMGAGLGTALFTFKWIATFIAGRIDKKEERLDGKEERILQRLEKQVQQLLARIDVFEDELEECKRLHAEERAERMKLAALLQAQGDVRNQVQTIVAADKLENRK